MSRVIKTSVRGAVVVAIALPASVASADSLLSQLHNTGQNYNARTEDSNWWVRPVWDQNNWYHPQTTLPDPAWAANTTSSKWLTTNCSATTQRPAGDFAGSYHYATTFDLTGYLRKSVVLTGFLMSDDYNIGLQANGSTAGTSISSSAFSGWASFGLTGTTALSKGANSLDFGIYNTGGVTGFRAEFTGFTADRDPDYYFDTGAAQSLVVKANSATVRSFTMNTWTSDSRYALYLGTFNASFSGAGGSASSVSRTSINSSSLTYTSSLLYTTAGDYTLNMNGAFNTYLPYDSAYSANGSVTRTFTVHVAQDLGDVSTQPLSITGTLAAGQVKWVAFHYDGQGALGYLDIDTRTSNFDTMIAVYDASGAVVASDDDHGGLLTSLLSFGTGSPSSFHNGTLPAGDYYLALVRFGGGGSFSSGFNASPSSSTGGNYVLSFSVPEPGGLGMLTLSGLSMLAQRRKRRRLE